MSIYLLFVDGVGLGEELDDNPLFRDRFPALERWSGGARWTEGKWDKKEGEDSILFSVDANMSVNGLPQSGTGQASLFTGINCAKKAGKHFGPFPHSTSKPLLAEKSLFHLWKDRGGSPHFMNAYPDRFFRDNQRPRRWSCTTYMAVFSGLELNREQDVQTGEALTAELDQNVWRDRLGIQVPVISMREAAQRVVEKGSVHDLVLFEYFLTDRAGHRQEMGKALEILHQLDHFLGELMGQMRREDTLVFCSDHGNVEDLSVRTHTRNRVPMGVFGSGTATVRTHPEFLYDLPRLLMEVSGREDVV